MTKSAEMTYNSLLRAGVTFEEGFLPLKDFSIKYHRGIFYSPDVDGISTKLTLLYNVVEFLISTGVQIGRVIFVDNEKRHFKEAPALIKKLIRKNIDLQLFHYKRLYTPFHGYSKDETLEAPDLSTFTFEKDLGGGTRSVSLFQDGEGKKWTLKLWTRAEHGYDECLGGELYGKMGGHVPSFFMYDDLPPALKENWGLLKERNGKSSLYRVAEYIEGKELTETFLQERLPAVFFPTAFISFWDSKPENYMVKDGALYLIDLGGCLLTRGTGRDKILGENNWQPGQISEFQCFLENKPYFKNLNLREALKNASLDLALLVDTVKDFSDHTHYGKRRDLIKFVESRHAHLTFLKDLEEGIIQTKADPFQKAHLGDAAGVIPYCIKNGKIYVLAGQRSGKGCWEIGFGGKTDPGELLYQTAARELAEETGGVLNLGDNILYYPSHDTIYMLNDFIFKTYRAYLVKVEQDIDPQTIKDSEHTAFAWIPLEELQKALKDNQMITDSKEETIHLKDGKVLFPASYRVLSQDQVQTWMTILLGGKTTPNGKTIPDGKTILKKNGAARCTRSLFGSNDLQKKKTPPVVRKDVHTEESDHMRFALAMTLLQKNYENAKITGPSPPAKENAPTNKTASFTMLDHLYKEDSQDDPLIKIKVVIAPYLTITDLQAAFFLRLAQAEEKHASKEVLYHGLKKELLFCYHALSTLRSMINNTPTKLTHLRSTDAFFDQFPTPWHLLQYIEEGHNNYSTGFKSAGLSCNLSIFSNLEIPTSSTVRYFLKDESLTFGVL